MSNMAEIEAEIRRRAELAELDEKMIRLFELEQVLRKIAYPPKDVSFSGDFARWAMEAARTALGGRNDLHWGR